MRSKTAFLLGILLFGGGLSIGLFSPLKQKVDNIFGNIAQPDAQGLYSVAEVKREIQALGNNPSAERLATCLSAMDSWPSKQDDESEIEKLKLQLINDLRKAVVQEVTELQTKSRTAATGRDGAEALSKAGQILALYPLSREQRVADEARRLSVQQADAAAHVESARRLRYNHWAAERAEAAIEGYHDNSSSIPGLTDKPELIELCVKELGKVDPSYLEPAVLDLYNYALDLIKSKISEDDRVTLAKRLTDTATQRMTLSDF